MRLRLTLLFVAGILLRIALLPAQGYKGDVTTFEDWMLALGSHGPRQLYADISGATFPRVDYAPGYFFLLWPLAALYVHVIAPWQPERGILILIFVKAIPILADLVLAAAVYRMALAAGSRTGALLACSLALLAPTFWLVSAYWGQADSVAVAFLALAGADALAERSISPWLWLAAAVLVKPQPLAFAPVLLTWQLRRHGFERSLFWAALGVTSLAYVVALPFAPSARPDVTLGWLVERYLFGYDKYPWDTASAWNVYAIAGPMYASDARQVFGLSLHAWGFLLSIGMVVAVCVHLWRTLADADATGRARSLLLAGTVALAAPYMLATRMHERYLLSALALASVVATFAPRLRLPIGGLIAVFAICCAFVMAGFFGGHHHPWTLTVVHLLAAVNVLLYAALAGAFFFGGLTPGRAPGRLRH